MRDITLEELLEAGCHFGHQVNRRNPKADEYIYEARSNVHIINLEKTREGLVNAAKYLKDLSAQGGSLIIVGTKRQAKTIVEDEVKRADGAGAKNLYHITARWVGGMLTNNQEISKNGEKLKKLNELLAAGTRSGYTKRELLLMEREKEKLRSLYGGVAGLKGFPDALYIVGTQLEETAVKEAYESGVPIVGIVDTNADPSKIKYPIPANDDAVKSISLITSYLVDAWIEGQKEAAKNAEKAEAAEKKEKEKKEKPAKEKKEEAKA